MVFGRLTNRDSLRDLILIIDAHKKKTYHLGLGKSITRSNLAKVNEKRNSKIFEQFAYHLIEISRRKRANDEYMIKGKVYAFDSTTIDLCLSVFCWTKFRKTKAGVKLHPLFDVVNHIPLFIHISAAKVNDINAMDFIPCETGAYYIFDRGYIDFKRLYYITKLSTFFVNHGKSNLRFRRVYSNKVDKSIDVLRD